MTKKDRVITASAIGLPNCYKYFQDGWVVIHIEGEPFERGKAYGYLITNELGQIKEMLEKMTPIFQGHSWQFFVQKTKEIYGHQIPEEYQQELKGIVEGVELMGGKWDYWELLAWNCHISIVHYWWKICQKKEGCDLERCSSFIATGNATETGGVILAHNTWDVYYNSQWCNCVVELVPSKGNSILMQTFYGYLSSLTDFFVTSAGIVGSDTTIRYFKAWKPGVPCFVRLRNALQYADNLTSFTECLLSGNGGDYANTWYLGDVNTGEIMKFDLGLKYHSIKTKKDGYFIGFNETESNKIRNLECTQSTLFNIKSGSGSRRVRLRQLMEQYLGKLTSESAKIIIGDGYDVYTKRYNHSHRSIASRYDMDDEGLPHLGPYFPSGAVDAKIITTDLAKNMSFLARWGSSSGIAFDKEEYCQKNPQWGFLKPYLKDRPIQPWTTISGTAQDIVKAKAETSDKKDKGKGKG